MNEREELERLRLKELEAKAAASSGDNSEELKKDSSIGRDVINTVGKASDYMGGLLRTGVASLAGSATGTDIGTKEDLSKALSGEAPTTSQYLERAGVPEGATLGDVIPKIKGEWYDPSVRGVAGFVGDVALDPLTWISAGLSNAAKAGKLTSTAGKAANAVLNPVESLQRAHANNLYKKAFSKVDKISTAENKAFPVSKVLHDTGFVGSMEDAAKHIKEINDSTGSQIGAIYKAAGDRGAQVDLVKELTPALEKADALRKKYGKVSPESIALADAIDNRIQYIWENTGGKIRPDELNDLKAHLADMVKNWSPDPSAQAKTKELRTVISSMGEGAKSALSKEEKSAVESLNKMYGATNKDIQDELIKQAGSVAEKRGGGFSKVDAMLTGLGLAGGGPSGGVSFLPLALKKSADVMQTTRGRTMRGAANKVIGEKAFGLEDAAMRQGIWNKMLKNKKEEEKR